MSWNLRVAVLLSGLALTGCGGNDSPLLPPLDYEVRYSVSADDYNAEDSEERFAECAGLPGATLASASESVPPTYTLRFHGSSSQQAALAPCLYDLPDVQVHTPMVWVTDPNASG